MKALHATRPLVLVLLACCLAGCAPASTVQSIELDAHELAGETVEVSLGQLLYVDTSSLGGEVEDFTADIADEAIVRFVEGANAGDFLVFPGFRPVKLGSTSVTMSNEPSGSDPLEFRIEVVPVPGE